MENHIRLAGPELKKKLERSTHCKVTIYDKEKQEDIWIRIVHVNYEENSIIGSVAQKPSIVKTVKQFQTVGLYFREIKDLYTEEL